MIEQSVSLASNGVVKVPGYEQLVRFGYTKNRGVYRLRVDATGEWEGLAIRCFWHVPDGKDPASSLVIDGSVDVPASVTAQPGSGCVTFEGSDGTKTVTSADLRYRVSANSGTEDGATPEPGTPAWQQLVDAVHADATATEQAKTDAQTAAQQAGASAQKAGQALSDTITAKEDALKAIGDKQAAATQAVDTKQTSATTAVESAKGKALDAVTDAQDTATQAVQAEQVSATTAVKKAGAEVLTSIPEDYQTTVQKVKELDAQKVETDEAISAVKARQNIIVGSETGNPLSVDDAFPAPLCGLTVYGKSTQDGTPTLDTPVPIVSAGESGSVAVKVTGANVLEKTAPGGQFSQFGATYTVNENGVLVTGTATSTSSFYLHKDKTPRLTHGTYYLTTKGLSASIVLNFFYVGKITSDVQNQQVMLTKDVEYSLTLQLQKGVTANTTVQVSLTRNKITTYSPYREQLLTLPTPNGLPGIPVASGGNYTDQNGQQWVCDEVDLEKGVRVQRVNAVDLSTCTITGTTELAVTKRLSIMLPIRGRDYKTEALCNKLQFLVSFSNDTPHFYVDTSNAQVFIPIGAKNPEEGEYILFYVLATPIETPLTPDEIAAYKALTAYGPDTVVQASDGAGVKLGYQRDVNIAIKRIEDAVASMT